MVSCYVHGNDAAVALAEFVAGDVQGFSVLMNDKAKELGLENTHFITPHGLDENEHYTTAYELAKIADYALNIQKFTQIVGTTSKTVSVDGTVKGLNNTNELLGSLNGVYGVKTGFTNGANRCLVTAVKRGDMDIISVVLGADTKKDRGRDSIKIIEYAFSKFEMVDMAKILHTEFDKIIQNTEFEISKGIENEIKLGLSSNEIDLYPVEKKNIKDITTKVEIQNKLKAPINEGEKLRRNYNQNR